MLATKARLDVAWLWWPWEKMEGRTGERNSVEKGETPLLSLLEKHVKKEGEKERRGEQGEERGRKGRQKERERRREVGLPSGMRNQWEEFQSYCQSSTTLIRMWCFKGKPVTGCGVGDGVTPMPTEPGSTSVCASLRPGVLKFAYQHQPVALLYITPGVPPASLWFSGSGLCISHKFPGSTDAAVPGTPTLRTAVLGVRD